MTGREYTIRWGAIGQPFEDISLVADITIDLSEDPAAFEPTYEHSFYPGQTFRVVGPTPADVAREIELLVDRGVSHIPINVETWATLRRFVSDVLPVLWLTPA